MASSDASNIECLIIRDGDEYIISGRKWWVSGANDPWCTTLIVMARPTRLPRRSGSNA